MAGLAFIATSMKRWSVGRLAMFYIVRQSATYWAGEVQLFATLTVAVTNVTAAHSCNVQLQPMIQLQMLTQT